MNPEFKKFFIAHSERTRGNAIVHVLRIFLQKIYESGIPLFQGFDRYEGWINGLCDTSYSPSEVYDLSEDYTAAYRKDMNSTLINFHMSVQRANLTDKNHFDATFLFIVTCASLLENTNFSIGATIVENIIRDYLR